MFWIFYYRYIFRLGSRWKRLNISCFTRIWYRFLIDSLIYENKKKKIKPFFFELSKKEIKISW